ncbi:MAG: phosphate ABC transporter permease subunit PstC, partial [Sneathiellales bacterium]|nr:phosphate ABC transporter permease subunit PstC [Sneathiellales bacterium]
MSISALIVTLLLMCAFGYWYSSKKVLAGKAAASGAVYPGRPHQFGMYVVIWGLAPPVLLFLVWFLFTLMPVDRSQGVLHQLDQIIFPTLALLAAAGGLYLSIQKIKPGLRVRKTLETTVFAILILASTISVFTTVGIVFSLLFETMNFFGKVPYTEFFFGLNWSPQTALRADQVGSSGAFGAIPLFAGTMLITLIAMIVAVPLGLLSAIYMTEYASNRFRAAVKPVLEILAGIPTVVYGFFAALTVGVFFRDAGTALGLDVVSESALAAGVVMGMMIIPFISSLSDDIIMAVPQSLRDGSYGLGATRSETVRKVILPAALPGIVGAVLLAVSRAIGETMIV